MPVDCNVGIDNAYNAPRRAHMAMLDRMNQLDHRPQLLGGGPLHEYALSGNNGAYPLDAERLAEYKRMDGKFSLGRTMRQVKEAVPASIRQPAVAAAKRVAKTAARQLAARAGLEQFSPLVDSEIDRLGGRFSLGKTIRQIKEAVPRQIRKPALALGKRAAKAAVKQLAARAGLEEFSPLAEVALDNAVGGINRFKKAKKWTGFAADTVSKGLDLGAKAKTLFGYGEMEGCGLTKGSAEAKERMAKLRAMRVKKPPKVKKPPGERALIVKQIMKERNISMIEASKAVKSEGLYQKKA